MNLEQHRQLFPGLNHKSYFNYGGQGILPSPALAEIINAYHDVETIGPFSLAMNAWVEETTAGVKSAIALELSVNPSTITLTENVTAGCNIALWGIPWQAGDQILLTDCEHPGIIAIVEELARRFHLEIAFCPILATLNQGDPVAVIEQYLQPNTRLVVLSHLLWNTGQILPLGAIVELCHHYPHSRQPIQVLVDAAQSVGSLALNLDALKVDFYAFTGHKWLCGPGGVGGLYISPEALETITPTFIGWRGLNYTDKVNPRSWTKDGSRFEVATSAYPLYHGLASAIALHQQWGTPEARYQQIRQLSSYLWQQLTEINGISCLKTSSPEAGLVSFQVEDKLSNQQLVVKLEQQGLMLRTIGDPYCVRACVHYFTLPSEIDHLIASISQILDT